MSVTLTDRDAGTTVLTLSSADAQGVAYAAAGGTTGDYKVARARHQNQGIVSVNGRHNFRLERKKVNALGVLKTLSVDITLSVPNDGTFATDDVDDLVTSASNYFAAETDTGNFIVGLNRS